MAQFRTSEERKVARMRNCVLHFLKESIAMTTFALSVYLTACSESDGRDSVGVVEIKDEKPVADDKNAINVDSLTNAIRQEVTNSLKDSLNKKTNETKSEINKDSIAEVLQSLRDSLNAKSDRDMSKTDQSVIRTLYAEDVDEFAKTDVYGAFANQYSLMYESFFYLDENGDTSTIPMPFPIILANLCDSISKELCSHKKIMVKSWIQGFSDTSTITDVIDPDTLIIRSPLFTFNEDALYALKSPKKTQRHIEAYALENDNKILFYSATKSITIHPMQNFGALEEAFDSRYSLYPEILIPYWYSVFVTPTADSISAMVGEIAKKLPNGKLLVYQQYPEDASVELSLKRVVKAVFEVLQSRGIKYIQSSGSASIGQRINYPVETLRKKEGICIETAVLFASILENLGFDVRIVITANHAFTGWATEKDGNIIDFVETTWIGDKNVSFADANNFGIDEFVEQKELGNFESGESYIVKVDLAREYGIIPNNVP